MNSLRFKNIPLISVAARISLGKEIPISASLIVDVAEQMSRENVSVRDLDRIESPPGLTQSFGLRMGPQIDGFALEFSDGVSAQVQRSLIGVRWASQGGTGQAFELPYPGYVNALLPSLKRVIACIEDLVGQSGLVPKVANMVYVNQVHSDLQGVRLRSLFHGLDSKLLGTPKVVFEALHSYRRTDEIDVRHHFELQDVESENPAFVISSSAGLLLENLALPAAYTCLDRVHCALLESFDSILTPEANAEWGREID